MKVAVPWSTPLHSTPWEWKIGNGRDNFNWHYNLSKLFLYLHKITLWMHGSHQLERISQSQMKEMLKFGNIISCTSVNTLPKMDSIFIPYFMKKNYFPGWFSMGYYRLPCSLVQFLNWNQAMKIIALIWLRIQTTLAIQPHLKFHLESELILKKGEIVVYLSFTTTYFRYSVSSNFLPWIDLGTIKVHPGGSYLSVVHPDYESKVPGFKV